MSWRAVLLALALGAMACQSAEREGLEAAQGAQPRREPVSAPFDVGAVIRRVHFAYRPVEGAWSGEHSTYAVRASAEGLTLSPVQHQRSGDSRRLEGLRASEAEPGEVVEGAPLKLGAARLERGERSLEGGALAQGRVAEDGHLMLARAGGLVEHLRNTEDGVEQSWTFEQAPEGEGELSIRIPVEGLSFIGVTGGGLHFADSRTGLGFRYGHATWVDAAGRKTPLSAEYREGHILLRVPSALLAASTYPATLDPIISPEQAMDTPVLAPAGGSQYNAAVASNGTDYLVVWQDTRASSSPVIYGARVTSTGSLLDPTGLRIATDSQRQLYPAVASNGVDWLVVWRDERKGSTNPDIYGTRVSAAGAVLDPVSVAINTVAGPQDSPTVSFNGTNYLVVWSDARDGVSWDIYGARVSTAGAVLDLMGLPISTAPNTQAFPTVKALGSDWLVVWQDGRNGVNTWDIYGARVSGAGAVLEPTGLPISTAASNQLIPVVGSNGAGWFVVWQDARNVSTSDVYGARVSSTGVVLDPTGLPISTAAGNQNNPVVASNGADYLVVWANALSTNAGDIYGARVSGAGQVVDVSGFVISAVAADQRIPVVASNGTDYLVAWTDDRNGGDDVYGTRVASTGAVLDPSGLPLSLIINNQLAPAVASNGTDYLVVWQDGRDTSSPDIYGVRVSGSGVLLDPSGVVIRASAYTASAPAVASNGTDWFVVWEESVGGQRVYGTRVTSAGAVLDPAGLPLCATAADQRAPAVASNGTDYFVAWSDSRGGTSPHIYGARVLASGTVVDSGGLALGTSANGEYTPAVASNGTDYLVAWRRNTGAAADVYGTQVTGSGVVLEPVGLALSTAPGGQYAPAVASNGTDYLVVWDDARVATDLDVYGTRVTSTGAVVDSAGLLISGGANEQRVPAVAFDGANYLVAWENFVRSSNTLDIRGARVTSAGALLEPDGMDISAGAAGESAVSLASVRGQSSFAVYQESLSDPQRIAGRFISYGSLSLTAPNGGEQWMAGSTQALSWTSSGVTQVKLEYSLDDGATWSLIADGVDATTGSYAWTVPGVGSTQARVRISEAQSGQPSDDSDAAFTLILPAKVIINEILANEPGSDVAAEFVELVNIGGQPVDMSGWTVSDTTQVRHTFAAGTVLGAGKAIVVFGALSAIPAGMTNAVASTGGTLSLANSTDSVTVKTPAGAVIDTFTYSGALSGTDGVSMNRSPDCSAAGTFVLHTALSPRASSAGVHVDGSGF